MKHADINLKLTHKAHAYPITAPSTATFGDLKNFAAKEIGIPPQGIQLLFRGRKKNDSDVLSLSGVKNGAEVKVMETDGYRQQKAEQVAQENPFLDFSEEAAAAARAAAAQDAKQQKGGPPGGKEHAQQRRQEPEQVPAPAPPPPQESARERGLRAIQAIRQQVDALEQQAHALQGAGQQQQKQPGAGKKAAGLIEMLTQKLLSLDNVVVEGDPEVRAARKGEINRINRLCDELEPSAAAGRQ